MHFTVEREEEPQRVISRVTPLTGSEARSLWERKSPGLGTSSTCRWCNVAACPVQLKSQQRMANLPVSLQESYKVCYGWLGVMRTDMGRRRAIQSLPCAPVAPHLCRLAPLRSPGESH